MKINIKSTNMDLTEEVKNYIEKKIGKTAKLFKKIKQDVLADVEVGRTTFHHQKGDVFRAEVNIQVPNKLLRAEKEANDIFAAIDGVKDDLKREITKYKKTAETKQRRGSRLLKKITKFTPFSKK